jgi:TonB family protein
VNRLATLSCIILSLSVTAQTKEIYYDYNWKPCAPENARFFSTLKKTDSGWFRNDYFLAGKRLQMQALYEDADCKIQNGHCYYFHANGKAEIIGMKVHDKQEGLCLRYHSNGMIADSAFYHNGIPVGSRIRWHRNGYMSDSIYHVNDSMDVQISWFDDGSLASAGYLLHDKAHGKWKFYHHNGNLSSEEIHDNGKVISKTFYNEDGTPQVAVPKADNEPSFKNDIAGWQKYLAKNLYWPKGYEFNNGNTAVVVVEFTINEEGKVENEEVVVPLYPEFDKIALRVIHNSPGWAPAVAHNRKVKFKFRQPVTFQQTDE